MNDNQPRQLQPWEYWGMALFLMVVVALAAWVLVSTDAAVPDSQAVPQPVAEAFRTEVIDAGEGITCVRVYLGRKTLHWECFR